MTSVLPAHFRTFLPTAFGQWTQIQRTDIKYSYVSRYDVIISHIYRISDNLNQLRVNERTASQLHAEYPSIACT